MNEFLFFLHILLVVAFVFGALRMGSSGLISLIVLQGIFANLFVVKQMTLFGLSVTCSDVFAIGGLLALNLLREFYGPEAASTAIRYSFLGMFFFILMSQIHLLYQPNGFDTTDGAFHTLLSSTPRIVFASYAVYWVVQQFDVKLFGYLKERFDGKRLALRIAISLILSQTIDTVLFSFLGLYGIVSSLIDIIVVSLIVKWVAIACSAPFSSFAKRFVRST